MKPALFLAAALTFAGSLPAFAQTASPDAITKAQQQNAAIAGSPANGGPGPFDKELAAGTLSKADYDRLMQIANSEVDKIGTTFASHLAEYVVDSKNGAGGAVNRIQDEVQAYRQAGGANNSKAMADMILATEADKMRVGDQTAVRLEVFARDVPDLYRKLIDARSKMAGADPALIQRQLHVIDIYQRNAEQAFYQYRTALDKRENALSTLTPSQREEFARMIEQARQNGEFTVNSDGEVEAGPNAPKPKPPYEKPPPADETSDSKSGTFTIKVEPMSVQPDAGASTSTVPSSRADQPRYTGQDVDDPAVRVPAAADLSFDLDSFDTPELTAAIIAFSSGGGAEGASGQGSGRATLAYQNGGKTAGAIPTSAWQAFENGSALTVAELEPIYKGWDINTAPVGSSGRSLDIFAYGPSSAGISPDLYGFGPSSVGVTPDLYLPSNLSALNTLPSNPGPALCGR